MAKDPVGGMEVDEKKALAKSQHMGKTLISLLRRAKGRLMKTPPSTPGPEGMKWLEMPVTKCSLGLLFEAPGKERQPCSFLNR